jgi:V/A-type H+-transporting ATPase subunit F
MRLAGIAGKEVHTREETLEQIEQLLEDKTCGLIIVSEKVLEFARDEIMEIKLTDKENLIIQIPEPEGFKEKDHIVKYIRESIGIKV